MSFGYGETERGLPKWMGNAVVVAVDAAAAVARHAGEVETQPKCREVRVTGAASWQSPWQLSSQRALQHCDYTVQHAQHCCINILYILYLSDIIHK